MRCRPTGEFHTNQKADLSRIAVEAIGARVEGAHSGCAVQRMATRLIGDSIFTNLLMSASRAEGVFVSRVSIEQAVRLNAWRSRII